MRTTELTALFDHLYWVNHRLLDAAERLPPGAFAATTADTTRDLRATLVHELDVEWSWRLSLQDRPADEWGEDKELRAEDYPDVASLRDHWRRDEAEMRAWIESLTEAHLDADVQPGLSREARPLWQFLVHLLTHASQQQADAATLLTKAGESPGEIGFLESLSAR